MKPRWAVVALDCSTVYHITEIEHTIKNPQVAVVDLFPSRQAASVACVALNDVALNPPTRDTAEERQRAFEDVPTALDYDNDCAPD